MRKTDGYCWRTLLAVIWTALVAQEGASNANGEAHAGAAAVVVQTWPLGDSIGVRQQYPGVFFVGRGCRTRREVTGRTEGCNLPGSVSTKWVRLVW